EGEAPVVERPADDDCLAPEGCQRIEIGQDADSARGDDCEPAVFDDRSGEIDVGALQGAVASDAGDEHPHHPCPGQAIEYLAQRTALVEPSLAGGLVATNIDRSHDPMTETGKTFGLPDGRRPHDHPFGAQVEDTPGDLGCSDAAAGLEANTGRAQPLPQGVIDLATSSAVEVDDMDTGRSFPDPASRRLDRVGTVFGDPGIVASKQPYDLSFED